MRKFNENLAGPQDIDEQKKDTTAPKSKAVLQFKLFTLTDEQIKKKASNLKFVYELPTTKEEVIALIN